MDKNEEKPKSTLKDRVISKYKEMKNHVGRNKTTYAVGTAGVVLTTLTFVVTRRVYAPTNIPGIGTAVKARNIGNVFVWIAPEPRALSYVIRCDQTKVIFRSQNHAARVMNLPKEQLSSYFNGGRNNVGGYTFTRLGIGA